MFEQAVLVEQVAHERFLNGVALPTEDFGANLRRTRSLLQARVPLFEAGLVADKLCARADILVPVGDDAWDIVEVKSSTGVKDFHIEDVAFQKQCYEMAGLRVRECFLMYINNRYIRDDQVDPYALFEVENVTEAVREAQTGVLERVQVMLRIIEEEHCPQTTVGRHCKVPYPCRVLGCWDTLPEDNVFCLYGGAEGAADLLQMGIVAVRDIPNTYPLTRKQRIQRDCALSGEPHLSREKILHFLGELRYPLYYLDFETFSPVIPLFRGTRPYQRIPFQFSVHRVGDPHAQAKHFSFLAHGVDDPRPEFLSALQATLGNEGSIVVYNEEFEKGVLRELADALPAYRGWVDAVLDRIVDLYTPFRSFHYYHPRQRGSASLKKVLPALTGSGYDGIGIRDGQDASSAFQAITYSETPEEERQRVRAELERYCSLDTEGMMWIVEHLKWIANL
jgi:hypothetical protein